VAAAVVLGCATVRPLFFSFLELIRQ